MYVMVKIDTIVFEIVGGGGGGLNPPSSESLAVCNIPDRVKNTIKMKDVQLSMSFYNYQHLLLILSSSIVNKLMSLNVHTIF